MVSKKIYTSHDYQALNKVTGLIAPTAGSDAVNLDYLNGVLGGLDFKDGAVVATTANITVATALVPGQVIDSRTLVEGDRVVVKDQTTASENGLFVSSATPYRALDMDTSGEFNNAVISVLTGTSAGKYYRQTAVDPVVGTDDIVFVEFAGGTTTNSHKETYSLVAGTTYTATHNLASTDVSVVVWEASTGSLLNGVMVSNRTTNTVDILTNVSSSNARIIVTSH